MEISGTGAGSARRGTNSRYHAAIAGLAALIGLNGAPTQAVTSTAPVTLTVWSWGPTALQQAALFEKYHPQIKVKVVNAGSGADEYNKMFVAFKAGTGAPDVALIE